MRRALALILGCLALSACGGDGDGSGGEPSINDQATAETQGDTGVVEEGDTEEGDTGRMSGGEYDYLRRYHEELVAESLQWGEYGTCPKIAQSGDLAGFRDCVEEAWDGLEDAALLAYTNADDTLADVDKTCKQLLTNYRDTVDEYYTRNLRAHDAAVSLDFESFARLFPPLGPLAQKYVRVSAQTLDGCSPQ